MQCPKPISIPDKSKKGGKPFIAVPCGKCGVCLARRRADWSFRLSQELKHAQSAYFLTLTYSDDEIPVSQFGFTTLRKRDVQLFLKRVRKHQSQYVSAKELPIRYYCVGEYGSTTHRPHYHILFFNLIKETVAVLDRLWPFGHFDLGQVTPASIHYVTKYHVNPNPAPSYELLEVVDKDTGEIVELPNREPEFATMSRRPGIGAAYLESHKKYHSDRLRPYVNNNGYRQSIPRYYREKFYESRFHKDLLKVRAEQSGTFSYNATIKSLTRRGIIDPDRYLFESRLNYARRLNNDRKRSDLF